MSLRRAAWTAAYLPILIGMLCLLGLLSVWKLPSLCCERLRAIRWLPLAGLCYYAAAVIAAALLLRLAWWQAALLAFFALGGDWLLPDPVTFLINPARRRAIRRAVEFVERQSGPRPVYRMAAPVGSEPGRQIVSVSFNGPYLPAPRRFFAVDADGRVEELDFEYVSAVHGVRPQY